MLISKETGLARWKGLSGAEKEKYKANILSRLIYSDTCLQVARYPRTPEDAKRKRSEEDDEQVVKRN